MDIRKLSAWRRLAVAAFLLVILGAARASAQVYSVNVVGYVRVAFYPGVNLFGNPLNLATNTVGLLLSGVPVGTVVYLMNNGVLEANGYCASGQWQDPTMVLKPGVGVWLSLPPGPPVTLTVVGEVQQGHLFRHVAAGASLLSSVVPQAGRLQSDLLFPPADGDVVYLGDGASQTSSRYDYSAAQGWSPAEPSIAVAQAFILSNHLAASSWERLFFVEPAASSRTDIGLRVFDGSQVLRILCEPLSQAGTPPPALRIAKNGVTYGIPLVEPDSPAATPIRIRTASGPKALAKETGYAPAIFIRSNSDGSVTLTWLGGGTLQTTTQVLGGWSDIPGAASAYTTLASDPVRFFRVRQ